MKKLTWKGKHTQSVLDKGVYPCAIQEDFPIWVATGGNVESTVKNCSKRFSYSLCHYRW